jgi:hypothetical protein
MKLEVCLISLIAVTLGTGSAFAGQKSDQAQKQAGSQGHELGVPEPGSVSDQESTHKQRKPSQHQSSRENAQVTVGGASSFVTGEVLKIEGDRYFIRDAESGNEVGLIVNRDTNMDCGAAPSSGGTMSTDRETGNTGATKQQQMQGQRQDETAAGSGFKVGDCSFKQGDKVKAEVSDVGTVTTLKFVSDDDMSGRRSQRSGTGPMGSASQSEGASADDARDKSPSREAIQNRAQGQEAPQGLRQK